MANANARGWDKIEAGNEAGHPRPWRRTAMEMPGTSGYTLIDGEDRRIVDGLTAPAADAIVAAVNAHDELVAALAQLAQHAEEAAASWTQSDLHSCHAADIRTLGDEVDNARDLLARLGRHGGAR